MSLNADALAYLEEKGLSFSEVIELARKMERKSDPTNAARQARHREKKRAGRNGVTVTPVIPNEEVSSNPVASSEPSGSSDATARVGYHRLPPNWVPSKPLPLKTQAKLDQWPPGAADDELAALHRWAANAKNENGKGKKLDWDAAWVNWIERRHDEHYGKQLGTGGKSGAWQRATATATALGPGGLG